MHSKSDNIEVANEIIEELFDMFLSRYQIGFKRQMKGSYFIFNCINLLC